MTEILTPDQMRAAEQAAFDSGATEAGLMTEAAGGIARWITTHLRQPEGRHPVIFGLAGPGNNGGDCLVTLALLAQQGWDARVNLVTRESVGAVPVGADELARIERVDDPALAAEADVIIDGVFGIGARPELPTEIADVLDVINGIAGQHCIPRVAIDCPSGVDTLTGAADERSFRADVTLCVGYPKIGLFRDPAASYAGELSVVDIGIEPPADFEGPRMITAEQVRGILPRRGAFARKGTSGGVLVIGGAPVYFGAPRLAGEAALRVGSGYVGLAVPRAIIGPIASQAPEIIYHPLSDGDGRRSARLVRGALAESDSRYTAAVLGPGLGRDEVAKAMLDDLLMPSAQAEAREERPLAFGIPRRVSETSDSGGGPVFGERPVVIDADALNWLSEQEDWPKLIAGLQAVLTPHGGEMARLLDVEVQEVTSDPFVVAAKAAAEWGALVVLKVGYTCVASPSGDVWVSPRAPSELATAGTGDVLSGLIGGFLAQGLEPLDAARAAIYVGAQAGGMARRDLGPNSVVARDVIAYAPRAINALLSPRWDRTTGGG